MTYQNLWGSIVNFCNDVVDSRQLAYPDADIKYIDWEAHANIQELPDGDLIGSTAITFTTESPGIVTVSFTIGISTSQDDKALFRLRNYVDEVAGQLQPEMKVAFYDRETVAQLGWIVITDGTMVMPMTRADVRPLQFVQCHGVLDPITADGR